MRNFMSYVDESSNFRKCYAESTGSFTDFWSIEMVPSSGSSSESRVSALFSLLEIEEISNERYGLTSQKS